jgi:hypothetical protein
MTSISHPAAAFEWDYSSIGKLATALRSRKTSASPPAAVPAFPHDHSEPIETRHLDIDGKVYPYCDACFIWADPATTCGLPATVAPIARLRRELRSRQSAPHQRPV